MPKRKRNRKESDTKVRYYEYLRSPEWKTFKVEKRAEEPPVCRSCKATKFVQLHHMIYRERPTDTVLSDTIWLCQPCHMLYHKAKPHAMKRNTPSAEMIAYTLEVIAISRVRADQATRSEKRLNEPAWTYAKQPAKPVVQSPALPKPIKQKKIKALVMRSLSSYTGVVVVPPAVKSTP